MAVVAEMKKSADASIEVAKPKRRRFENTQGKQIREADFAKRLQSACDNNPLVPPPNFGRLGWFVEQLQQQFNETVSVESVRKWLNGETKPRPDKVSQLAQILNVDEAWLSLGRAPELTPRDQKVRNAAASGAVNLVAGLIEMNGGHPAFPAEGDARAEEAMIDLYAIIKGAQYAFHVALGQQVDGGWKFAVPAHYEDAFQIGVIQIDDLAVQLVEIPHEQIAEIGHRKGGSVEIVMGDVEATRIKSFRNRL